MSLECTHSQCSASLDPKSLALLETVTLAERNSPYPVGETCSPLSGFSQSLSFGDRNEACTQLQMFLRGELMNRASTEKCLVHKQAVKSGKEDIKRAQARIG